MFKKITLLFLVLVAVFVLAARNPGAWDTIRRMNLGDFAATTSAQLLAVLSDATGTGLAVFGTSPTIATPTITGNATISGTLTALINSTVLTNTEGTHDGGNNVAIMTDGGESFTTSNYVGMTIYNNTDGSSCTVTANDGTTITCTLAGGTDDDWDTSDTWSVAPGPDQSGSLFYISSATTVLHPATAYYVAGYYSTAANVIKVDPQSGSMQITLNGDPTGTNGEEIDSPGAAGDFIWIHNQSATVAVTHGRSGVFIDGGAS